MKKYVIILLLTMSSTIHPMLPALLNGCRYRNPYIPQNCISDSARFRDKRIAEGKVALQKPTSVPQKYPIVRTHSKDLNKSRTQK